MYFLFRYHDILPSEYKKIGFGEKKIIRNFMYKELEDKANEKEQINNIFGGLI